MKAWLNMDQQTSNSRTPFPKPELLEKLCNILQNNPSYAEEFQKFWKGERRELRGNELSVAERIRDIAKPRSPMDYPEINQILTKSGKSNENCSCGGNCVCHKLWEYFTKFVKELLNDPFTRQDRSKKDRSSSVNDVDVVFVAMTLKKNIVSDPVILFQKANGYWIGTKDAWEKKYSQLKNIKTFNTIENIDTDGFVLVTYEIKFPQNRVPQGPLAIQNALRGKNISPHYYTLLPPETGTFLHDFK